MKILFFSIVLFLIAISCSSNKLAEDDIYEYMSICFQEYYDLYGVDIERELTKFEDLLIRDNYLENSNGESYKKLLKKLQEENYYHHPFNFTSFNNVLLYENPSDIFDCVRTVYSVDSIAIMELSFPQLLLEISDRLEKKEEVSIHYFFEVYQRRLSTEELEKPFVRESVLLFLYRWYYQSKLKWEEILEVE